MIKFLTVTAMVAAILGAATPFAAIAIDSTKGVDALYIRGYADAAEQSAYEARQAALYSDGDAPAAYHGEPLAAKAERIVVYEAAQLVRPQTGPAKGLTLYRVIGDTRPLQAQSVLVVARMATGGLLFGAGLLFLFAWLMRRRQPA
jgi:hypothetical protein